jgi:hypothetical protein
MMGKQEAPEQLFYDFRLEDHVPAGHMLRQLDKVLRFDSIRQRWLRITATRAAPRLTPS